ncbi:MAG: glucose-1-phosphate adenylyltransferase subunit GlgD [Eubacteriales bacterium]|nr:glucose-1-phosphate adenylyltransferase subunit GlgD [Eubacteriales bacterium]
MKRMLGLITTNYNFGDFGLLTKERPIASIPFGGRYRLVDFAFSNMVNSDMDSVGLITPYLYRSLLDHVGNGKAWGLARKNGGLFILPGSVYGLLNSKSKLVLRDIKGNSMFIKRTKRELLVIQSASKIFNINYKDVRDFHDKNNAAITLVYKKQENILSDTDFNLEITSDNRVLSINRKENGPVNQFMDAIIINIDLVKKIMEWYDKQSYMDIMDIISEILPNIAVYAYEFKDYSHNIDNMLDYMHASKELLNINVFRELFSENRPIITKVHDAPPVKYEKKSKVTNTIISSGSIIKGQVENSIIFRNVIIEEGAKVSNSVVFPGSYIGKNAELDNIIVEKYAKIEDGQILKCTNDRPIIITREQFI